MPDLRLGTLLLAGALLGCSGSTDDTAGASNAGNSTAGSSTAGGPAGSAASSSAGSSPAGSPLTTSASAGASATDPALPQLDAPDDVAAPPADAFSSPSGLASKVLVPGSGSRFPGPTATVRVNYSGWQTDGTRFDSSVARGSPSEFPLNRVIAGWTEGLQLMVEGEERRFWIPEDLAYAGRQAPYGTLVFDVELISIVSP
jgi:hypothetical protein